MRRGCCVVRIETDRLILRAWRQDDFRPYHALIQNPAVHRHFGPDPMGQEECWRRITSAVGGWQLNGFGTWAVERKSDGKLVGNVGLLTAWRDMEPQFGEEPEMGWIMAAETHGHGLASEAGRAVLAWAETTLEPTPLWAIIAPANTPSIALAERLGFARAGDSVYNGEPTLVLRRPPWSPR